MSDRNTVRYRTVYDIRCHYFIRPSFDSVADPNPDPHVFGPPQSGSGYISQRYGSGPGSGSGTGSSYRHEKIVRNTLIPTILL
jgi:hypothetical protein